MDVMKVNLSVSLAYTVNNSPNSTGRVVWSCGWYYEGQFYLLSRWICTKLFCQVTSDEEAIKLMNDSPYGLTASIWTNAAQNPDSEEAFLTLSDSMESGTVFLNRCDYLDPALAWTGVKDSGRGTSLSRFGTPPAL